MTPIEKAIYLLQQSGYDVFQKDACLILTVASSVDNYAYAKFNKEDGFKRHLESQLLTQLARVPKFAGALTYEFFPELPDATGNPYHSRSEHRLTMRTYPADRKEWAR